MTIKRIFKKIGKNIQQVGGGLTKSLGKGLGGILGVAAGKSLLSSLTAAAPEIAEAAPLLLLKRGGRVPGRRNKPVLFVGHGSEYILPANAKPTKKQKSIVASNKKKQKMGSFVYG